MKTSFISFFVTHDVRFMYLGLKNQNFISHHQEFSIQNFGIFDKLSVQETASLSICKTCFVILGLPFPFFEFKPAQDSCLTWLRCKMNCNINSHDSEPTHAWRIHQQQMYNSYAGCERVRNTMNAIQYFRNKCSSSLAISAHNQLVIRKSLNIWIKSTFYLVPQTDLRLGV